MSEFTSTGSNAHEFTVSELSGALKRTVEDQFGHVRVRAEISGLKQADSGHVYLTLKDDKAVLDGVMWRGSAAKLSFRPEDGLEVVCTGKLTTYPGRSKYQIVIDSMAPAGVGALMALLEERKKKLAAEGLFAQERKKPLPYMPKVIGVVTSPTGAVIRDILHRLRDRFPTHVLLWPVLVQGETAASQIAGAIRGFNAIEGEGDVPRPDLIIVARGGGSLEDLWAFNEEEVVRAAAESSIPLISAVGHETDTTLIDYVSDQRAPTPTAAAEMAVPVRSELLAYTDDLDRRVRRGLLRLIEDKRDRLRNLARGLRDPQSMLQDKIMHLDHLDNRLQSSMRNQLTSRQQAFAGLSGLLRPELLSRGITQNLERIDSFSGRMLRAVSVINSRANDRLQSNARLLESLSFKKVLSRGYSIIKDEKGRVIKSASEASEGLSAIAEFSDGNRHLLFTDKTVAAEKPKRASKPKRSEPDQGTLL
ncbi:exodeoxyribonuclease VII large subunit [Sneathiella glossodoripedis]|uniref:exodeoxyribonuclease VII large subunit n=1 Tax=Sneathiella glossodoripedis TaxID=418853 RepID=UPI00046FAD3A|nr:exodeoxyribonuclease VII large subunit [Sneathiella glossodoripedis]